MKQVAVTMSELITIRNLIRRHRLIKDRISELSDIGYNIQTRPMGAGGVCQMKETQNEVRIQIGYGVGKYNYAPCIVITKATSNINFLTYKAKHNVY